MWLLFLHCIRINSQKCGHIAFLGASYAAALEKSFPVVFFFFFCFPVVLVLHLPLHYSTCLWEEKIIWFANQKEKDGSNSLLLYKSLYVYLWTLMLEIRTHVIRPLWKKFVYKQILRDHFFNQWLSCSLFKQLHLSY